MKNWDKSRVSSFSQKVKMMDRYNDTVVEPEFLNFVGVSGGTPLCDRGRLGLWFSLLLVYRDI